jgi:hypothetical protein
VHLLVTALRLQWISKYSFLLHLQLQLQLQLSVSYLHVSNNTKLSTNGDKTNLLPTACYRSMTKLGSPVVIGRAQLLTAQGSASLGGLRGDAVNVVMAAAVGLGARLSAAKTGVPTRTSRLISYYREGNPNK